MANVLLTTKCNLSCPYCFAQERLGDDHKLAMSISNVEKVIEFLKRRAILSSAPWAESQPCIPNFRAS